MGSSPSGASTSIVAQEPLRAGIMPRRPVRPVVGHAGRVGVRRWSDPISVRTRHGAGRHQRAQDGQAGQGGDHRRRRVAGQLAHQWRTGDATGHDTRVSGGDAGSVVGAAPQGLAGPEARWSGGAPLGVGGLHDPLGGQGGDGQDHGDGHADEQDEPASVPAVKAWTVASHEQREAGDVDRRQALRGSRRRASDVSSTASSRYMPTTPQATADGRHVAGEGHEHRDQGEVDVGVQQDGQDVDAHEDGGQAAEPAVQVEHPGRARTVAEGPGPVRHGEAPEHRGAEQGPGDQAGRAGDVPGERAAHRSHPP